MELFQETNAGRLGDKIGYDDGLTLVGWHRKRRKKNPCIQSSVPTNT